VANNERTTREVPADVVSSGLGAAVIAVPNQSQAWRRAEPEVAVLIPCYNEAPSIAAVVRDFRAHLPHARVYVYDNSSSDRTAELAALAGAIVGTEPMRGKGNVVRRMFADVEADVYVLVDGDGTYDTFVAGAAIRDLTSRSLDVVNVARRVDSSATYRCGHRFGNIVLTGMVGAIFGRRFGDMLSGYKVFSRRFVKSFPALAQGFEIETELTVHALGLRMPVGEIEAPYRERSGSSSKLRTIRDGVAILATILVLLKEERPLLFFSCLALALASASFLLAWPLAVTYLETSVVPRFPTAILCTGLMILAFLSLTCGLVLDTVTRGRREMKRLHYLSLPAPEVSEAAGVRQ
jgi:Glycosyl transferase family 2